MASQSLPQTHRVKDIRDMFVESISAEITSKLCSSDPEPLTPAEVQRLEETQQAGSNAFNAAWMGLQVMDDFIYKAQEEPGDAPLNQASALLGLLAEIVYQAHEADTGASTYLAMHYKALAMRNESPSKPAKRGAK